MSRCLGSQDALQKQTSAVSIISLGELNLKQSQILYIPDFTVRAKTDLQYIRIRRAHYLVARRATLMERQQKSLQGITCEDQFEEEWRKAQIAITPDQAKSDSDSVRDDLSPKDVTIKGFYDSKNSLKSLKEDMLAQTKSPKRVSTASSENPCASIEIPLITRTTNAEIHGS